MNNLPFDIIHEIFCTISNLQDLWKTVSLSKHLYDAFSARRRTIIAEVSSKEDDSESDDFEWYNPEWYNSKLYNAESDKWTKHPVLERIVFIQKLGSKYKHCREDALALFEGTWRRLIYVEEYNYGGRGSSLSRTLFRLLDGTNFGDDRLSFWRCIWNIWLKHATEELEQPKSRIRWLYGFYAAKSLELVLHKSRRPRKLQETLDMRYDLMKLAVTCRPFAWDAIMLAAASLNAISETFRSYKYELEYIAREEVEKQTWETWEQTLANVSFNANPKIWFGGAMGVLLEVVLPANKVREAKKIAYPLTLKHKLLIALEREILGAREEVERDWERRLENEEWGSALVAADYLDGLCGDAVKGQINLQRMWENREQASLHLWQYTFILGCRLYPDEYDGDDIFPKMLKAWEKATATAYAEIASKSFKYILQEVVADRCVPNEAMDTWLESVNDQRWEDAIQATKGFVLD